MDESAVTSSAIDWLAGNATQLVITLAVVSLYLLLDRFSTPRIAEGADQSRFKDDAAAKAIRIARLLTGLFGVLIVALIWGVDFGSIAIFAGTALTLLGVALFASWSLLSNVTAYFVLLLHPSFRRGTFVRIIELDNYAEGYISELTLFNTKLITEHREVIVYPNNLLLGRPAIINPRDRLAGVGKLPASRASTEPADAPVFED